MINGTLRARVRIAVKTIIYPNPLNILIPKAKSKTQIRSVEICPSLIADRLLFSAALIAEVSDFPSCTSSFILSKMRMLASTAIPIERMIAAIPLRESA